jgi:hypothetical protein
MVWRLLSPEQIGRIGAWPLTEGEICGFWPYLAASHMTEKKACIAASL